MLVIRSKQMKALEQAALGLFEEEMIDHSKDFSPRLCEVIGDEQFRVAVHSAIERAMSYGFTNRGPIRLFIEMMFLYGSAFDTDPQYPRVGIILRDPSDQMWRAEQIHKDQLHYLEEVSGPNALHVHIALRNLRAFAQRPISFSSDNFVAGMLQAAHNIFSEKASYIGKENLTALIEEGRTDAKNFGFSTGRGQALVVILMFAFGHGCARDPLYPWIQRTLQDERITAPADRAARLEKKALTWLDFVIARNEKREQT